MNRQIRDQIRLRIDAVVSGYKPQVDANFCVVKFIGVEVTPDQQMVLRKQITKKITKGALKLQKEGSKK